MSSSFTKDLPGEEDLLAERTKQEFNHASSSSSGEAASKDDDDPPDDPAKDHKKNDVRSSEAAKDAGFFAPTPDNFLENNQLNELDFNEQASLDQDQGLSLDR